MKISGVVDSLGNRFRRGQIVLVHMGQVPQLAQVVEIEPPAVLESPGGQSLPTLGKLVLQVILPLDVRSGEAVQGVWVLEQPAAVPTQ